MRLVVAVILSMLASAVALGGPAAIKVGGIDYAVPANANLRFAGSGEPFQSAVFKGRIGLTGVYYYYGRVSGHRGDERKGLYFVPDARDAASLPYWKESGPVRELRFSNAEAFLKAVVPEEAAREVERGRRPSVQGRVAIVADGFQATVLCGAGIYLTRFRAIEAKPVLFASQTVRPRTTC